MRRFRGHFGVTHLPDPPESWNRGFGVGRMETVIVSNFCSDCGVAVEPSANFCGDCGAKLEPEPNVEEAAIRWEDWIDSTQRWWRPDVAHVPFDVLCALAGDPKSGVRGLVARHPDTPKKVLTTLAGDSSAWVRHMVAENRNAPIELLPGLVRGLYDDDWANDSVWSRIEGIEDESELRFLAAQRTMPGRENVFGNVHLPRDLLQMGATDTDEMVREAVAYNAATPASVLQSLSTDPSPRVREMVAGREETPQDALRLLSTDPEPRIRQTVALNSATPPDVLHALRRDDELLAGEELAASASIELGVPEVWDDGLALSEDSARALACIQSWERALVEKEIEVEDLRERKRLYGKRDRSIRDRLRTVREDVAKKKRVIGKLKADYRKKYPADYDVYIRR